MRQSLSVVAVLMCSLGFASLAVADEDANKQLVRRHINEVWNKGNVNIVDTLAATNFVRFGPTSATSAHGRDAFKKYVTKTLSSYTGLQVAIDKITANDDKVVVQWTATGTFLGTDELPVTTKKSIKISGTSVTRIQAGKIVEERVSWDVLDWFRQVGIDPPLDQSQQNMALVHRAISETYNKGNISAIDGLFATRCIGHSLGDGETISGIEAFKDAVIKARTGFPDLYLTINDMVVEQDKVVAYWTARGTHKGEYRSVAPTSKPFTVSGLTMYRIVDGKIAETWSAWDRSELFRQLGVTPPEKTGSR